MNFNEIFRKNVTCDNTKSDNKLGLHPLAKKDNFRKTTGRQIDPPLSLEYSSKVQKTDRKSHFRSI